MRRSIIYIDFLLWGTEITPKEISERTGIMPDVGFMKGERNPYLVLPRENLWSISSRSRVESDIVSDHWDYLRGILMCKEYILKEIAQTGMAKLTVVINSPPRIPSIIIPPEMSTFAGFIDAIIDIDHLQC
jgi:hypothetical protein